MISIYCIQLHLHYNLLRWVLLLFHFTDEDIKVQNELTCLNGKWWRWDSHQICESRCHDLNDQCILPEFRLVWPRSLYLGEKLALLAL